MSTHHLDATWRELRGWGKTQWGRLTDDDFAVFAGTRETLTARVEKRYGIPREEASRRVNEWIHEPGVLDDWNDTRSILDL